MTETMENYQTTRWDLGDLFPGHDSSEMEGTMAELEAAVAEFESLRDKLSADMDLEDFIEILHTQEKNSRLANRIGQFAGLWYTEDTQNQDALTFQAKIQQFMAGLQNRTMFFSLWWKSLTDDEAKPFQARSGEFEYYLQKMRNFKQYTLTEPEEKIINIKDVTGASALQTLYSSITNRYTFKIEIDGEEKEITQGELLGNVFSPDPDLRERAYRELFRVYSADSSIIGQIYQSLVRDWRNENVDLRGYKTPIAARNLVNDIPDEVVQTLMDVSEKNASLFQRFFALKAKLLGQEKLRRFDIYAPVAGSDKLYDFDYAAKLTLQSFRDFEPRVADLAERVFSEDHIDSEIRKGKQSGAFCSSGDPDITPFVLMNYEGKARDISTLAHELGHAIHAMLAEKHNVFNFHSSLPLAETASTFAEMLLIDRFLEEEKDEDVRRDVLFGQVSDSYATIGRQIFFAMFERDAHEAIANGASTDEVADIYFNNLKTQFGDSLELDEVFKWEWLYVSHFYQVPFYVYAYSFGQLLVLALYKQYKEEGEAFKPRYIDLLTAGGSMSPEDILTKAGVDMRSADFWQGGFDVLEGMISELEELTA